LPEVIGGEIRPGYNRGSRRRRGSSVCRNKGVVPSTLPSPCAFAVTRNPAAAHQGRRASDALDSVHCHRRRRRLLYRKHRKQTDSSLHSQQLPSSSHPPRWSIRRLYHIKYTILCFSSCDNVHSDAHNAQKPPPASPVDPRNRRHHQCARCCPFELWCQRRSRGVAPQRSHLQAAKQ
jgi:hypothetical protein